MLPKHPLRSAQSLRWREEQTRSQNPGAWIEIVSHQGQSDIEDEGNEEEDEGELHRTRRAKKELNDLPGDDHKRYRVDQISSCALLGGGERGNQDHGCQVPQASMLRRNY